MANEFVVKNGLISQNNSTVSGSLIVTQGITGSLLGTASYVTGSVFNSLNLALSASFAISASWAPTATQVIGVTGSTIYTLNPAAGSNFSTNGSIILGDLAGQDAESASNSVFIGPSAGAGAKFSENSNFIGNSAGNSIFNGSASFSNFIGHYAGNNAVSASYTTLIGYKVGSNPGAISNIKSNNIIIGTNITLPAGAQDSINLGGIIFATGSYSNTTAALPFSGSADGRVGINVVTPTYTLDVNGSGNYTSGLTVTGSLRAPNITGSLFGTASYITGSIFSGTNLALSSSFALTASVLAGGSAGLTYQQVQRLIALGI